MMLSRSFLIRPRYVFSIGACVLIFVVWYLLGPPKPMMPKHRPDGVPADALWVGGADGGAYVRCVASLTMSANRCEVWNDSTGKLGEVGEYVLRGQARAATEDELKTISFPDFGGHIYLARNLVLDRVR